MDRRTFLSAAMAFSTSYTMPAHAETLRWMEVQTRDARLRGFANQAQGDWRAAIAPGAPCQPRFFAKVLEGLAPDIQAVALERPGYGARDEAPVLDLARQADALMAAARPRGERRKRTILIGHSFGAPIATYAAARAPRAVDGLVLVSPFFVPVAPSVVGLLDVASHWLEGADLLAPHLRVARAEVAAHAEYMKRVAGKLDRIAAPTILIHDRQDGVTPANNAQWLIDNLNPQRLVDVVWTTGAGHETPAYAADAIIAAVRKLTRA